MKKGFFEGQDFGSQKFKALMPEFYPTNYQEYIKQETILLKQKLAGVKTVLEAGVGIGRIIPEIAPLVEEFVGIDNADLMLSEAQKQASKFPNVKIIKGYLESLSTIFPRNHFERSICIWNTLGNVEDESQVLQQLKTVTYGSIIVTTYLKGTLEDRKNWYKTVGIKIKEIDEEDEIFYSETGLRSKSYSLEDMIEIAKKSGLEVVDSKVLADLILWTEFKKI